MSHGDRDNLVVIRILDHVYSIRSDEEDRIRHIADYINQHIERIKSDTPASNRIDLCVMAAFSAASELFDVRDELERLKKKVELESEALSERISNRLLDTSC